MSGAHDQARDAARRLLEDVKKCQAAGQVMIMGVACIEDIETVARYLGVKEERPKVVRPKIIRHSNSQIMGQHVCDVNCREEYR